MFTEPMGLTPNGLSTQKHTMCNHDNKENKIFLKRPIRPIIVIIYNKSKYAAGVVEVQTAT